MKLSTLHIQIHYLEEDEYVATAIFEEDGTMYLAVGGGDSTKNALLMVITKLFARMQIGASIKEKGQTDDIDDLPF